VGPEGYKSLGGGASLRKIMQITNTKLSTKWNIYLELEVTTNYKFIKS
jgi:hypothetical protein